ncbi:MAG: hypothetical protein EA350_12880 [Gemmatimonadales bacterium]|nr:MAG: hypothetical protein EA350_12880 [Gemmatimonadales bacterium]
MRFIRIFLDRLTIDGSASASIRTVSIARFISMSLSAFVAASFLTSPLSLHAQQMVVDDAAITEPGACQVEAWWGEAEQWVLPACTLLPRTEVTLGAGWFDRGAGSTDPHLFAEAKLLARDSDALPWGWGVVVGTALSLESGGERVSQLFAFVPVTVNLETLPLVLHANAGWALEREVHGDHAHDHQGFLWGLRGDLAISERLALLGEVMGLSGDEAEGQAGVRLFVVPDRLAMDLSYGFSLNSDEDGLGFQLGLAWTPAPFR